MLLIEKCHKTWRHVWDTMEKSNLRFLDVCYHRLRVYTFLIHSVMTILQSGTIKPMPQSPLDIVDPWNGNLSDSSLQKIPRLWPGMNKYIIRTERETYDKFSLLPLLNHSTGEFLKFLQPSQRRLSSSKRVASKMISTRTTVESWAQKQSMLSRIGLKVVQLQNLSLTAFSITSAVLDPFIHRFKTWLSRRQSHLWMLWNFLSIHSNVQMNLHIHNPLLAIATVIKGCNRCW